MLNKHQSIFKAKRGNWMEQDVNIELKSNYIPYHARPYRVPEVCKKALRKDIAWLEE